MSKVVVSIAVVLLLTAGVAGLWWAGFLDSFIPKTEMVEETSAPETPTPASELSTGGNNSDEALEQDLQTLDAQLTGYSETSSELDASLADEPVEQDTDF
jgi:hypothetical protein